MHKSKNGREEFQAIPQKTVMCIKMGNQMFKEFLLGIK